MRHSKKFAKSAAILLALSLAASALSACGYDDYGYDDYGYGGPGPGDERGYGEGGRGYDDDYGYDDEYGYPGDEYGYEDDEYWDDGSWNDDEDWGEGGRGEGGKGRYNGGENYDDYDYEIVATADEFGFGSLGSASEMEGTTVVVSIFADDSKTSWTSSDDSLKNDSEKYLAMACQWITDNAADYGCDADFIYDWTQHSDLYYETKINTDLTSDDIDTDTWEYIYENVDTTGIMSDYAADNIIYMVLVNTPLSNDNTSCTRNYYDGMEYPFEVCYMYMGCDGEKEAPAAFAHEMLHTFGAPDLYMADEDGYNYGTTERMVEYYESTNSNDIMFTTYDAVNYTTYYDRISNDFTELDAYYVGITDHSSEVDKWGLEESQH